MNHTTIPVTFQLEGAVRQLRTVETLVTPFIYTYQTNGKVKEIRKGHFVKNEPSYCIKTMDIPVSAFLNLPSRSALRTATRNGLIKWGKLPKKTCAKLFAKLPLSIKVQIHMDDYCVDLKANGASWPELAN